MTAKREWTWDLGASRRGDRVCFRHSDHSRDRYFGSGIRCSQDSIDRVQKLTPDLAKGSLVSRTDRLSDFISR